MAGDDTATKALTDAHTVLGTVFYMAPEQVEGREADGRSDVWALGAMLYEMATGQRPFAGDSTASVMSAILRDAVPLVSTRLPLTPPAFDHIVERCLQKDPDERWQNAGDVKRELQWIASGRSGSGVAPAAPPTVQRSRASWAIAAAALSIGAVLGAARDCFCGRTRRRRSRSAASFRLFRRLASEREPRSRCRLTDATSPLLA